MIPGVDEGEQTAQFNVTGSMIRGLIESTSFAMAQQDVRYYLNGMLWEVTHNQLRVLQQMGIA